MSGIYRFGAYEFASSRVELRKHGLRIKVPDQSLKILAALVAEPGELVSRERIQALLWPNGTIVGFERSINTAVRRLREALGDTAAKPKYVESVPRHGYRFIATVESFQAEQPQGQAQAGSLLLHYRLLEKVGAGSMGEVWKAEDMELRRTVALKLLPEFLAGQSQAIDGLRQEARHAAALNHPNICTIHGIEQCGGRWFLVMEYIDGHPLSQELTQAPFPIGRIRDAGIQIAEALAAAHSQGVIHRDVTPSNLLMSNGIFKLTDFGIAQLSTGGGGAAQGNPAGTIGYMSPEQALGHPVDGRSDLFSLGVVLYRMATGRMPFGQDTPADVIEARPHQAPVAPGALNPAIPRALERVILKALERNLRARWQSAGEMAKALRALHVPPNGVGNASRRFPVAAGLVLASALGAGAWFALGRRPADAVTKVSAIAALPGQQWDSALSPDGRQLAFVWDGEGRGSHDIYVQLIGEGTPRRLTRDPAFEWGPVWSPDARHIAFLRETDRGVNVVIVPSAGGTERIVHRSTAHCRFEMKRTVAEFCGVAWSPDGKHLAVTDTEPPRGSNSIFLLNLESGDRRRLTNPPAGWFGDGLSRFSPDGRVLAFARSRAPFANDLFKLTLSPAYEAAGEPHPLTRDGFVFGFDFTADGRGVVYASRQGGASALWEISASGGQPQRLQVSGSRAMWPSISRTGERLTFTEGILDYNLWRTPLASSDGSAANGSPVRLAYSPQLDFQPSISPDGKRVAFASDRSGNFEIWTCQAEGSSCTRLTYLNGALSSPKWSPDGKHIVCWGRPDPSQQHKAHVYVVEADGGKLRRLTTGDFQETMPSWSRDGNWIYFSSGRGDGGNQVWKAPVSGGQPLQLTRNGGARPVESWDGRYIYYRRAASIWKMNSSGGEEFTVMTIGVQDLWDLAESGIYILDGSKTGPAIDLFSFETLTRSRVLTLQGPAGDYIWGNGSLSVSPDQRWAVYEHKDREESSIMVASGFR